MKPAQPEERLHKFLARAGVCSRRHAEELIAAGRVAVNGSTVTVLGTKIIAGQDQVSVDGRPVAPEELHLYLFHKPRGIVSTMRDTRGRASIADFTANLPVRVFPVGRLDSDVSGLMLLTNDGAFAEQLLHPRYGVERRYIARVAGSFNQRSVELLTRGLELKDGFGSALYVREVQDDDAAVQLVGAAGAGEALLELGAAEGRKHFVKRLLFAAGLPVIALSRAAFGPFELGDLPVQAMREIRDYRAKIRPAGTDEV